jgi:hypothetical protein
MEKPIRVPVMLCAGCEAAYDHTRDEAPCCETYRPSRSQTGVAHLVPDSLEARLMELGREYAEYSALIDSRSRFGGTITIEDCCPLSTALATVREHPDFTPAP